jgi:excinuclease UvrABC nuclease subunit
MVTAQLKTIDLDFDGHWREVKLESVPDQSGIYSVYACSRTAEKKVALRELVYIGESVHVRTRIAEHLDGVAGPKWRRRLKQREELCFAFVSKDKINRERAEAALIFKHKPPMNTQCVNEFQYEPESCRLAGRHYSPQTS